jgi:hypothetical protein
MEKHKPDTENCGRIVMTIDLRVGVVEAAGDSKLKVRNLASGRSCR